MKEWAIIWSGDARWLPRILTVARVIRRTHLMEVESDMLPARKWRVDASLVHSVCVDTLVIDPALKVRRFVELIAKVSQNELTWRETTTSTEGVRRNVTWLFGAARFDDLKASYPAPLLQHLLAEQAIKGDPTNDLLIDAGRRAWDAYMAS